MQKRTFGKTGYEVGEVGLGCWQIGGNWRELDDSAAFAILEAAHVNGIDFFDTADVYGGGRSERLIGEFCRAHGLKPIIATKHGRMDVYPDSYSEEALRDGVEGSCERLKVDRLDLLQLHCIPTAILQRGEIFGWLDALVEEGTLRAWGASVETVEEGIHCLQQPGCRSLQIIFNVFRQKPLEVLLPMAAEKQVAIIARLPLASGLLSGQFTAETQFEANDHRSFNRDGAHFNVGETFAGLPFEKGVEIADELRAMVPATMTMAQWALRWLLDHPAVSVVIPGASRPAQVSGNIEASQFHPLAAEVHADLKSYYTTHIAPHIRGAY